MPRWADDSWHIAMAVTRRKFISASAYALATLAAGAQLKNELVASIFKPTLPRSRTLSPRTAIYTSCHQCDQQCAEVAYVNDGVVVKLDGNPIDQKSKGRLCPKGQAGILEVYNPYRLKKPMVRTNPEKGFNVDPGWKEVTWEEALDQLSGKLTDIINKYGARAIAGADSSSISSFFRAIGSPNMFQSGNLCYYSEILTQVEVTGGQFNNSDLIGGLTKCVVMFSNTAETVENPFGGQVGEAKAGGAKTVVFDPRLTDTAAFADEWVPIRPGTDLAAMLALINVLITENLYDKEFVEENTYGFDKLTEFCKQYTPEWAENITDVPAATLLRIAREFGTTRPSVATIRRGPSKQRKGYWRVFHAWTILNALVGSIDVRGTTIADRYAQLGSVRTPSTPPPTYPHAIDGREFLQTPGGVGDAYLWEAGTQDSFADSVLNGPYPVKALLFAWANPMHSAPNRQKWTEALRACFVVDIDYQMTDTAWFADLVLPCPTYLERDEVVNASLYEPKPQINCRQKVINPLYDTKEEGEIWLELGKRMGIDQYLPPVGVGALDARLAPQGITFEDFKKKGVIIIDRPFEPTRKFGTPTGKIELYSKRFEETGFDPMPAWKGPSIEPSNDYPLYFVSFNDSTKYMTMHDWNPWLEELMDPSLWINTATASTAGISEGDQVYVESQWGKLKARAKLTEGIRPDTVALAHGRGFQNPQTAPCAREGASDNYLTRPASRADHMEWYRNKEEPLAIARFMDFTVKLSRAE
jgi:thiosulfate reductase/polysulfide reductase chain A